MDAITDVPTPVNEPVHDYAPGSPERGRLVAALDAFGAVALGLEVIGQQKRQVRLVLDDEYARQGGDAAGANGVSSYLIHGVTLPGASNSYSCRPLGRSAGSVDPVTR